MTAPWLCDGCMADFTNDAPEPHTPTCGVVAGTSQEMQHNNDTEAAEAKGMEAALLRQWEYLERTKPRRLMDGVTLHPKEADGPLPVIYLLPGPSVVTEEPA